MRKLTLWGATAGLALSIFAGCSQNAMTVRGQAPMDGYAIPGVTPQSQMYAGPAPSNMSPPVASGSMPYGMPFDPTTPGGAPYWSGNGWGENGPNAEQPGYLGQNTFGYERGFKMQYKEPRDLRFPPVGDSPAVVQYQYYTFKGPDDFFYGGIAKSGGR